MVWLVVWQDWGWASFTSRWWKYCPSCPHYELFLSLSLPLHMSIVLFSCWVYSDESDKANVSGGRCLKNGLKFSSEPWPSAFIAAVFTFISTCLKCVMSSLLSILSLRLALHIHLRLAILQTDAIKQWKCFVCFPLARQMLPSRPYTSTSRRAWHGQMETSMQRCTFRPF